jgi:hypothetical protein
MTLKRNGATLVAPFLLYFEYDLTTLFKHPHGQRTADSG